MKCTPVGLMASLLLLTSCFSHRSIPDFEQLKPVNGQYNGDDYTLVIYGAIGCGYSQAAIKKLRDYRGCKAFQLIVIEDDSTETINEHQNSFFAGATFFSNEDKRLRFKNFFPQYFLYKNEKLVWRKKGYVKHAGPILDEKMECSR